MLMSKRCLLSLLLLIMLLALHVARAWCRNRLSCHRGRSSLSTTCCGTICRFVCLSHLPLLSRCLPIQKTALRCCFAELLHVLQITLVSQYSISTVLLLDLDNRILIIALVHAMRIAVEPVSIHHDCVPGRRWTQTLLGSSCRICTCLELLLELLACPVKCSPVLLCLCQVPHVGC